MRHAPFNNTAWLPASVREPPFSHIRGTYMKIVWNDQACCHSGNCVKTLPQVFKVENGQFLIQPENASDAQIQQVVTACPGKALSIE